MDALTSPPLVVPLPRPALGSAVRIPVGRHTLVLEAARGCHSLLWTDGVTARRHVLALPRDGHLTLQLRVPSSTVFVATRDVLLLAPRARLRGYVQVPLVPTVVWHDSAATSHVVLELRPRELAAEWDEVLGHTLHASSAWHTRFPVRSDEPRVVVPLHVRNDSNTVLSPPALAVQLGAAELRSKRGSIVVPPRRLVWTDTWHDVRRRPLDRQGVPA
jgi:hypothetical protein